MEGVDVVAEHVVVVASLCLLDDERCLSLT